MVKGCVVASFLYPYGLLAVYAVVAVVNFVVFWEQTAEEAVPPFCPSYT